MRTAILFVIIVGASAIPPSAAAAQGLGFANEDAMGRLQGWYVGIEIHASFLSDIRGMSNVLPTFGYAVRVGHRWNDMAGFVQIEQNLWRETESSNRNLSLGALNVALGFDGILRRRQGAYVGGGRGVDSARLDAAGRSWERRPLLRAPPHRAPMDGRGKHRLQLSIR